MIQTLSNWVCYRTSTAKPVYHASNTCPAWTQLLSQRDCIYTSRPSRLGQGYNSSHSGPENHQAEGLSRKNYPKYEKNGPIPPGNLSPVSTHTQSWPQCSSCPSAAGCACKAKTQLWMGQGSSHLAHALSTALSSTAAWESSTERIF